MSNSTQHEFLESLVVPNDESFGDYYQVVNTVGREAADKLLEEFQGSSLYFPKLLLRYRAHVRVYEQWRDNVDIQSIARRNGYSISRTRAIINEMRQKVAESRKARNTQRHSS